MVIKSACDCVNPRARLAKLIERRDHIDQTIAQLEDRKSIISGEIREIYRDNPDLRPLEWIVVRQNGSP